MYFYHEWAAEGGKITTRTDQVFPFPYRKPLTANRVSGQWAHLK